MKNKIIKIEKQMGESLIGLQKLKIINKKGNNYLENEKDELLEFYKNNLIKTFKNLKKLIKKNKTNIWIFKFNINNLILKRYLLIKYFIFLVDIDNSFGEHSEFIRKLLYQNYKKHLGYYTIFIYKPKNITIINLPKLIFLKNNKSIYKDIYKYSQIDLDLFDFNRFDLDLKHYKTYIKNYIKPFLYNFFKNIGLLVARIRFTKRKKGYISDENLEKYLQIAKPGDIFLTRGNWNASNISIPGFWKHMSMYMGTGAYINETFSDYINETYDNNTHYIVDATSEGVKIKEINKLLYTNDYLGVFRTNFSNEKIISSIKNILKQLGKSYDFLFDFHTEDSVVCSELILKGFMKKNIDDIGIDIELKNIGLNFAFPPNSFIEYVEEQLSNKEHIIKPIFFIDSIEKAGKNFVSTPEELLKSRRRSRFTFLLKK